MAKQQFSRFKLKDALSLVQQRSTLEWTIDAPPMPPSQALLTHLERLSVFDLSVTESAKELLIDALFAEVVALHPTLKVWKSAPLSTDTITGVADYLLTPRYDYIEKPLLCVAEAKRDDFLMGKTQCIAEMYACQWTNTQEGLTLDVHGIVSNGQGWEFYQLDTQGRVHQSELYTLLDLPRLLGVLDQMLGECARLLSLTKN